MFCNKRRKRGDTPAVQGHRKGDDTMKIGITIAKLSRNEGGGKRTMRLGGVACEAMSERYGSDPDIDKSKQHLNTYELNGF
jgi:hypothetical protein